MAFSPQELQSQINASFGLARPNRFEVKINTRNIDTSKSGNGVGLLSGGISSIFSNGLSAILNKVGLKDIAQARRLTLFCDQAELPAKSFASTENRHYGPTYNTPYQAIYSRIRLRFLVGSDMKEKYFFDGWQYAIEDPETFNYSYLQDYATTITISQLEETGGLIGAATNELAKVSPVLGEVASLATGVASGLGLIPPESGVTYQAILTEAWPISVDNLTLDYADDNTPHRLIVTFAYKRWYTGGLFLDSARAISGIGNGPVGGFSSLINGT